MAWILDTLSWGLLLAGGAFCIVGALGLVRMPDSCTRVHAASLIDTTGAGLMLLGLMLQAGFTLVSVKLVALCLLLLLASPTATHALVAAALHRGIKPLLADDEEKPPSKP